MTGKRYPDRPVPAVAVLVCRDGKFLAVERGHPPGEGTWALPGGSVELGETLQEAAEREVLEETGITVRAGPPFTVVDAIYRDDSGGVAFHYVIAYLRAEYLRGRLRPMDDVRDARWITLEELASRHVEPEVIGILGRALKAWNQTW